jgi:type I restriction enzyme S subunit
MKKYDTYKPSGVEWIGEIPEHWEEKKFKHIFSEKKKTTNVDLPCGSISFAKVVYKDDEKVPESTKRSYQVLSKGDFLINPLNLNYDLVSLRIALSDKDVVVSSGYIILNNNLKLNKNYFKWLLHIFDVVYMKTLGSGVRQTLSFTHIANCELVFPPIEEQNKMAEFLENKTTKIDQAIAIKQKQIELLKERRQIVIHKAVTRGLNENVKLKDSGVEWIGQIPEHWEVVKIKQCSEKISKGTTPSTEGREILHEGEIRFLKSENIFEGFITKKPIFFIDRKTDFIMKRSSLKLNDVLFVIAGASLGKVAVLTNEFLPANTNQAVSFIRPNYKIQPYFLSNFLVSNTIKELTWLEAVQSAQPNLSMESLGNFPITLPSIEEQKEIVEFIETATTAIATAISLKEQEIEKLKEYKMSLIDGVVTGKVKVC